MKSVDVLLGLQWGDEGKGKVVDVLTPKYDVIRHEYPDKKNTTKKQSLLKLCQQKHPKA